MRQAFLATQSIETSNKDWNCNSNACVKEWLQMSILSEILKGSPKEAEGLLANAEASIRSPVITQLVDSNLSSKDLEHARQLLTQVADESDYPFASATKLIEVLPKENSADRLAVFTQALGNFEQYGSVGAIAQQDLGTLISGVWEKLPSDVVLEAVDKMLEEAKSKKGSAEDFHISMSAKGDSFSMDSLYQVRLFQLLPVIEALDPSRAESLLRENAQASANLKRFPKGMPHPDSISFGIGGASTHDGMQVQQETRGQIQRRIELVINEASNDPHQAWSDAMALPVSDPAVFGSPRIAALGAIAGASTKKDPRLARSAMDEILKLADQISSQQGLVLATVPEMYLSLGDPEGAKKAIKVLAKLAEKMYADDSNPDDPNQVFKGQWPSSNLWQHCVQAAANPSPELVEEIVAAIPDDDIAAFQKISRASSLLGAPQAQMSIAQRHKDGNSFTMMAP